MSIMTTSFSNSVPLNVAIKHSAELPAWELEETYHGREDGLKEVQVIFTLAEKKFGPAETSKSGRDIVKIVEKYTRPKIGDGSTFSARILNAQDIFQRTFDFENNRIFIKFFHEKGQIFCKTAEFYVLSNTSPEELSEDDVKVFIVDPRDQRPSLHELRDLFRDQLRSQSLAIDRVEVSESEINVLLEDRMKELSANELNVVVFDIKRNLHILKVRNEKSLKKRGKGDEEENESLDMDIDFLAPYLTKFEDLESLTKPQVSQIRDECLSTIRLSLKSKEDELSQQITDTAAEIEANKSIWTNDTFNSKKFYLNVLEMRLKRQKDASIAYYANAEGKILNDNRIKHLLK